jgi:hypothetical protein
VPETIILTKKVPITKKDKKRPKKLAQQSGIMEYGAVLVDNIPLEEASAEVIRVDYELQDEAPAEAISSLNRVSGRPQDMAYKRQLRRMQSLILHHNIGDSEHPLFNVANLKKNYTKYY